MSARKREAVIVDVLTNAYVALLELPPNSRVRYDNQAVYCQLRDLLAELTETDGETIQTACEERAQKRVDLK